MLSLVCSNTVVAVIIIAVVKILLLRVYNPFNWHYIRIVLVFLSDVVFVVLTFIASSLNKMNTYDIILKLTTHYTA